PSYRLVVDSKQPVVDAEASLLGRTMRRNLDDTHGFVRPS
ncbi:MAG: hypothetical protein RLZZ450_7269, partial [Pseudomonadota bacterium]